METSALEFDVIVIGAGSGNTLIGPELADRRVALIDDGRWFGGTCLNAGCIPTKMLVRVADIAASADDADRLGLAATTAVDWPSVRDRVFGRTDSISEGGLQYRVEDCPNVTVYRESFGFEDQHTLVSASGERLHAPTIVIAAGSRPRPLPARYEPDPGIHDSDSIMRVAELPASLAIVGGGAVAVEFAHVFSAFGVDVTLVTRSTRLLGSADRDISDRFTELADRRWRHLPRQTVTAIERDGGQLRLTLSSGDTIAAEAVLVAIGRVPNTDTLAAASVGFDLHEDGRLMVDPQQRVYAGGRPAPGVFALGDVNSAWQLKHVANHEARIVQHNITYPDALIGGDPGPVPSAVFSDPEVAHFGLTEEQARARAERGDGAYVTVTQDYGGTAYGWGWEDTTSFCKLVVAAGSGQLLGAHIIGPEASILIQPLILAASLEIGVRGLARAQYWPHPAATEVVENALLKAEEALREHEKSDAEGAA